MGATAATPILIELDPEFWKGQLDRVEGWLGNVVLTQSAFRELAEDVRDKLPQPQFHHFLEGIAEDARRHEEQIAGFYRMIGRDPAARGRATLGTVVAKGREILADIEGFAGGASGPWRDLRQLYQASLSATAAFGVVEQLGYALGHKEMAELAFEIVNAKHRRHLQLQEMVLEMAAVAILYDEPTDALFGPSTPPDPA
jgi:hypothetical protein